MNGTVTGASRAKRIEKGGQTIGVRLPLGHSDHYFVLDGYWAPSCDTTVISQENLAELINKFRLSN
jgi:hypothetical protein